MGTWQGSVRNYHDASLQKGLRGGMSVNQQKRADTGHVTVLVHPLSACAHVLCLPCCLIIAHFVYVYPGLNFFVHSQMPWLDARSCS